MSTTFGISIPTTGETVEIAHRYGSGDGKVNITIKNPLVYLLQPELKVISLDNTAQGINTIGDLLDQSIK